MKLKQEDYFFPSDWVVEVEEIRRIDAPISEIELPEIDWLLDIDWFGTDEAPLTPNEVLSDPALDPEHFARIEKADLSYPIDLGLNPKVGKLMQFDGLHRICKAKMLGLKTIKCRIIPIEKVMKGSN